MDPNKITFTVEKTNRDALGSELDPLEMSDLLAFIGSNWDKSLGNMFMILGHEKYRLFIKKVLQTYVNLT